MLVTSSMECAQRCLMDQRCESLNYHHPAIDTDESSCELNNSTKKRNKEAFKEDASTTYYHLISQVMYINNFLTRSRKNSSVEGPSVKMDLRSAKLE